MHSEWPTQCGCDTEEARGAIQGHTIILINLSLLATGRPATFGGLCLA